MQQIDLLRHGEPEGGTRYRGHIDDPLNERGWEQMRDAVDGKDRWDIIYHSSLVRCAAFARELGQALSIPVIEKAALKEIGFGTWEGRTGAELIAEDEDAYRSFYHDPVNHQPEGAERLRDFYLRVTDTYEAIAGDDRYENPLVITHAGVMRAIITHVLKAPLLSMYRMQIRSAGLVSIRFSKHRPPSLQI